MEESGSHLSRSLRSFAANNSRSAFTMIEIAIAIGVIGFALVAVIGILPLGLNVQKENREDAVISQEAPFFINAIRNGTTNLPAPGTNVLTGFDYLTKYVTKITLNGVPQTYTSGQQIIGLLSTPTFGGPAAGNTNNIVANVRSLTGSAMEQGGADPTMAFSYQMTVQISPFATSFNTTQQDPHLGVNLYDLRLLFAWPILPNGSIGPYRQTYRTLISAPLIQSTIPGLWYFARQNYTLTNAIYGATNSY